MMSAMTSMAPQHQLEVQRAADQGQGLQHGKAHQLQES